MDLRLHYTVLFIMVISLIWSEHSNALPSSKETHHRLEKRNSDWSERQPLQAPSEIVEASTRIPKVVRKVRLQNTPKRVMDKVDGSTIETTNNGTTTKVVRVRKYRRKSTPVKATSTTTATSDTSSVWVTTAKPERFQKNQNVGSTTFKPPEEFSHITVINKVTRDPKPNRKNKAKKQLWVPKLVASDKVVNDVINVDKKLLSNSKPFEFSSDKNDVTETDKMPLNRQNSPVFLSGTNQEQNNHFQEENKKYRKAEEIITKIPFKSQRQPELKKQVDKLLEENKSGGNVAKPPLPAFSSVNYDAPKSLEVMKEPTIKAEERHPFSVSDIETNSPTVQTPKRGSSKLRENPYDTYDIPVEDVMKPDRFMTHDNKKPTVEMQRMPPSNFQGVMKENLQPIPSLQHIPQQTEQRNPQQMLQQIPPQTLQQIPPIQSYQNFGFQQNYPLQGSVGFRSYPYRQDNQQNYFPPWAYQHQQPRTPPPFMLLRNPPNGYQQPSDPYSGVPSFYSPRLVSLRRSIMDSYPSSDEEEISRGDDEVTTEFSIPKFDMPDIDFSNKDCRTVYREVKAVPNNNVAESNAKSLVMTRECYFPEGVPTLPPDVNAKSKIESR